jgi:hypothetical protein
MSNAQLSEAAQPERVAERHHGVAREDDDRERALEPRQDFLDGLLDRRRVARGQHRRDHLGVGGAEQPDALRRQLVAQLDRVDQVAVVPQRDLALVRAVDRL